MKIIINIVAFITFIVQFLSFVYNVLTLKKPSCLIEELYNYFAFSAFLCSLMTVAIFLVQYNFNAGILNKKSVNCLLLVIVLLSIYICVWQIFVLHDFFLSSCILLIFNFYIIRGTLRKLF